MSYRKISDKYIPTFNPTDGMPRHPNYEKMPVIWADQGDVWLFRRITQPLIPREVVRALGDKYDEEEYVKSLGVPKNPIVRFACAGIKRAEKRGGGVDFVLWAEEETINPENQTSTVNLTLAFGPSHFDSQDRLNENYDIIMKSFEVMYENGEFYDALKDQE